MNCTRGASGYNKAECYHLRDEFCTSLTHGNQVYQISNGTDNGLFTPLAFGSQIGCLLVFYVIWRVPELRVHPMALFMYIAFAESFIFSNAVTNDKICGDNFVIARMLAFSLWGDGIDPAN